MDYADESIQDFDEFFIEKNKYKNKKSPFHR